MLAEDNDHYTIGNKGDDVDNKLQEPTFLMDDVPLTGASSFFAVPSSYGEWPGLVVQSK